MTICWYRHTHENRNDLLRFGLMRLHANKQITYIEKNIQQATEANFSNGLANDEHKHLSFIEIADKNIRKKIVVDNEDSFIHCSKYIAEADYYFTAAYNTAFYKHKLFPKVYDWQTEKETQWYISKSAEIIKDLGKHFHKVKPFIPITPNLSYSVKNNFIKQKLINIISRFTTQFKGNNFWRPVLHDYEARYKQLKKLRLSKLEYDIVLNDTLWGWPKHRIKLHRELKKLGAKYNIHSILNWHKPYINDGSVSLNIDAGEFPITCGEAINDYEKMLSESKLGVFAVGFHWGWRNIMTLALFTGIPVLIDKPILEPYFDMDNFKLLYNDSGNWDTIQPILDSITIEKWNEIKMLNQKTYDQYLSPEAVANYFINTVMAGMVS